MSSRSRSASQLLSTQTLKKISDDLRTPESILETKVVPASLTFFATPLLKSGSNLAASNSFPNVRATFDPSATPAPGFVHRFMALETASAIRFADRERYMASKGATARKRRTVSGD